MPMHLPKTVTSRFTPLLAVGALSLGLAACGGSSSDNAASSASSAGAAKASNAEVPEVTWSMGYPVSSLDPAKAFNTSSLIGMSIGLESLVGVDKDGHIVPQLATSVETPDATTYVYHLRDGVTFWDGSSMTADDVVFSLERHRDPKVASQMSGFFTSVKSVEKTGPLEVTVKLNRADSSWQFVPALAGQVVSKKFAESVGDKALGGSDKLTMGTGPYRFSDFRPDEELQAVRYDGYWGPKPAVQKVIVRTIEDDSTRLLAQRSGETDGSFYLPPGPYKQWQRLANTNTYEVPGTDSYMFIFNTELPEFGDVHVRRAFAHALDRDGLANKLLKGHAEPAQLFIPKRVWTSLLTPEEVDAFYATLPTYEFDMEKAKAELAKSKFPNGFDVTVKVPSATDQLSKAALALAANLKSLNIDMKVEEIPSPQWVNRIQGHEDLSFETMGEASVLPDPAYYAGFLDGEEAKPNGRNFASFQNATATDAFQAQRETTDPKVRAEELKKVARVAAEELPYLGVYWQKSNVAVSKELVYDDLGPWFYITNWAAKIKAAE